MFYTIYKITNQINGKIYIGSHKTKNLDDGYMGSGKYLRYAQTKYGIENFTKEILHVFETPDEMYAKEAEIVNEDFLATENTYNIKVGGFGGWDFINGNEELRVAKNQKARVAANLKIQELYGVETAGQIESVRAASRDNLARLRAEGRIKPPPRFTGKSHTEETKRKIGNANSKAQQGAGNSQYGTRWIHNPSDCINKKISKHDPLPPGWVEGRKMKF